MADEAEMGLIRLIPKKAAQETGLEDAFVLVIDLGDFSVNYRVGGFTEDIGKLLSKKSILRKNVLKMMHDNSIEIVSPNFMNQRVLASEDKMIPEQVHVAPEPEKSAPEDMIFDKADIAAEREDLKQKMSEAKQRIREIEAEIKSNKNGDNSALEKEREMLGSRVADMKTEVEKELPGD